MLGVIGGFIAGVISATIACYFVIRNNRKRVDEFIDKPELLFNQVEEKFGKLSADAKAKWEEVLAEINKKQKKAKKK